MDEHFEAILRVHKQESERIEQGHDRYQQELKTLSQDKQNIYIEMEQRYHDAHQHHLDDYTLALDTIKAQEALLVQHQIEAYRVKFEATTQKHKEQLLSEVTLNHGT